MTFNQPIFLIDGAPASGKSTIARALMQRFQTGFKVSVDDLREWVVSGIAHPVGWTDETTRQFRLAEEAAADLAIRYNDAGFAVAIDHCVAPMIFDTMASGRLSGRNVHRIALIPNLEVNLMRNESREGKSFDPSVLTKSIENLNPLFSGDSWDSSEWHLINNTALTIEETVSAVLDRIREVSP